MSTNSGLQIFYLMEINKLRNEILTYQNEGYYLISKMDPVTSYYTARLGLNMSSPLCAEMALFSERQIMCCLG